MNIRIFYKKNSILLQKSFNTDPSSPSGEFPITRKNGSPIGEPNQVEDLYVIPKCFSECNQDEVLYVINPKDNNKKQDPPYGDYIHGKAVMTYQSFGLDKNKKDW